MKTAFILFLVIGAGVVGTALFLFFRVLRSFIITIRDKKKLEADNE